MHCVRLDSEQKTYILGIKDGGLPYLLYWGDKLFWAEDCNSLYLASIPPVFQGGLDTPYQLNVFPEAGTGFRGSPALIGDRDGEGWTHQFSLVELTEDGANAFFSYRDELAEIDLRLEFQLHPSGVMQRKTAITNSGTSPYVLQFCAASATPVPSFCDKVMRFHGCWTGEFMKTISPFSEGLLSTENRTGRTSHEHFPAILAGTEFKEESGTIYATHLGWSGNAKCIADLVADGTKQLQCGELLLPGEGKLEPDETYTSPWSYETCSTRGLNEISSNFHRFFREDIAPKNLHKKDRPVQFNTWEALYFDHTEEKLQEMATTAAQLGVERFVLDDGWFHGRNNDTKALGDWWPDAEKYPHGLGPICDYVTGLGMEFGLWMEPEMVNENSELYRQHPDWAMHLDGMETTYGRNQRVLDLCNDEVCDYLFDRVNKLLCDHPIAYLKWDMNRILTEAGHKGKALVSVQTKALYQLLNRLRQAHPEVEIESCASGGGRIDFEILKRTERFWASDSNDPWRRLEIQEGASLFFPPEVIGSHIGPKFCHTSGRVSELSFRTMVALGYHFGAELNILELTEKEKKELQSFVSLYKEKRSLLHRGKFLRLESGENSKQGYGVVAEDKSEALFFVHQTDLDGQSADRTVRFCGLNPNVHYRLDFLYPQNSVEAEKILPTGGESQPGSQLFSGTFLMQWGLPLFFVWPGSSALLQFTEKK